MIRVGVVRGGISPEYEVSLETGGAILNVLRENLSDTYVPVDILIDREGVFYMNGLPVTPEKLRMSVDVIWNGLHGFYGEDGKISQLFENLGIPYTGSGPFAAALSMHKVHAKGALSHLEINTPSHFMLARYNETFDFSPEMYAHTKAREVFEKMPPPWIVKPVSGGSSVGTSVANTMPELIDAIQLLTDVDNDILVEEFIMGKEATVGVVDDFRGEKHYAFLPIEIAKPADIHFDYALKYSGEAQEISPGRFTALESKKLQELARMVHTALDLSHYSRADFIVHPKKGIYFLEINSLPGLTSESLIPKMVRTVGSTFAEFVDHVIKLAIKEK